MTFELNRLEFNADRYPVKALVGRQKLIAKSVHANIALLWEVNCQLLLYEFKSMQFEQT
jgi:hypothetical protein